MNRGQRLKLWLHVIVVTIEFFLLFLIYIFFFFLESQIRFFAVITTRAVLFIFLAFQRLFAIRIVPELDFSPRRSRPLFSFSPRAVTALIISDVTACLPPAWNIILEPAPVIPARIRPRCVAPGQAIRRTCANTGRVCSFPAARHRLARPVRRNNDRRRYDTFNV